MSRIMYTYKGPVRIQFADIDNGNYPIIDICNDISTSVVCDDTTDISDVIKQIKEQLYHKLRSFNDWLSGSYNQLVINEFNISMEKMDKKKNRYYIYNEPIGIITLNPVYHSDDPEAYTIVHHVHKQYLIHAIIHEQTYALDNLETRIAVFNRFIRAINDNIIAEYCHNINTESYDTFRIAVNYDKFTEISEQEAKDLTSPNILVSKYEKLEVEV